MIPACVPLSSSHNTLPLSFTGKHSGDILVVVNSIHPTRLVLYILVSVEMVYAVRGPPSSSLAHAICMTLSVRSLGPFLPVQFIYPTFYSHQNPHLLKENLLLIVFRHSCE